MKRKVNDIFINAYNKKIMRIFKANIDLQICINPYAAGKYVSKYMTKAESGSSQLLKALDNKTTSLKQMDKLDYLASALDKHRETSIQEIIYRLLGLAMT